MPLALPSSLSLVSRVAGDILTPSMVGGAYVVLALSSGLSAGIIGKIKGSSFFLWFLISAIPPFIGLVAAVLYRNEYDEPHRRCPTCRKIVPVYDALCTRCGTELEFPGTPLAPVEPAAH